MSRAEDGSSPRPAGEERRLRAMLEAMHDVVLVVDAAGRYLEIGPSRPDLLYRPPPALLGRTVREVFAPERAAQFEAAITGVCRDGRSRTIEYPLPIAGREMWFEARLSPMLAAGDACPVVVVVIRDATERKQVEERSERQARYLTCVADVAQLLLAAPDPRAVLPGVLASIGGATGVDRCHFSETRTAAGGGLLLSRTAEWAAPGVEPRLADPRLRELPLAEAGFARWIDLLRRGEPVAGHVAGFPESERPLLESQDVRSLLLLPLAVQGGCECFLGLDACRAPRSWERAEVDFLRAVAQDLAQAIARAHALETLRESEERFRRLAAATSEAIAIHDRGVILDANDAFARLFRVPPDRVVGRSVLEFAAPASVERVRGNFLAGVEEPYEAEGLRADGSTFLGELTGRALPYGGRSVRVTAVRDVTERRRLEERLREAQKMEAVGRLAGGIAHDFNNLLTAITGHGAFLLGALPAEHPARSEVEAIRGAADRAATLTRRLLAFGRRQVLELRVVSLADVLGGVEKTLHRVLGEDIDLRVVHAPDTGNVRVDVAQMEQVLLNLALNAREAMPRGGRLMLETANAELDASYVETHPEATAGSHVMLSVGDSGVGMPPEVLARMFEPFFTTKDGGTGLGLPMVHGIIRQFGGHAQVYSEVGRGTTVKLYLPRVKAAAEPARAGPPVAEGEWPTGSETVLVVEDNELVRGLAVRVLRTQGYVVLDAPHPDAALRLAAAHAGDIHLLLTDVVMPGHSGRELAAVLCAARPALRVLYMSGYTDNVIAHHGVLEPGTPFLEKPFTPQALARKVRAVLDER
ncbi:MAG: PAS domain S-box protein [Deltaproteobacteria bacterium]|nr:PAS domain S-box protein [Deltaproteobacteria bacterium]